MNPGLCFTAFSVTETLAAIQSALFPEIVYPVNIYFVGRGTLGCIWHGGQRAIIYAHQLFNHSQTPFEVITFLCKHELLHLRIPPGEEDGRRVGHTAAFWAAERSMCPERTEAWEWIWVNFGLYLKHRPRLQRVDVLPGWGNAWKAPRMDVAACREVLAGGKEIVSIESGW